MKRLNRTKKGCKDGSGYTPPMSKSQFIRMRHINGHYNAWRKVLIKIRLGIFVTKKRREELSKQS